MRTVSVWVRMAGAKEFTQLVVIYGRRTFSLSVCGAEVLAVNDVPRRVLRRLVWRIFRVGQKEAR